MGTILSSRFGALNRIRLLPEATCFTPRRTVAPIHWTADIEPGAAMSDRHRAAKPGAAGIRR